MDGTSGGIFFSRIRQRPPDGVRATILTSMWRRLYKSVGLVLMVWSCLKGQTGTDDAANPMPVWCVRLCKVPASPPPVRALPYGWEITTPDEEERTRALAQPSPLPRQPSLPIPTSAHAEGRLVLDQVFDSDAESGSDVYDYLHDTPSPAASESPVLTTIPGHASMPQSAAASEVSSIGDCFLRYG